MNALEERAELRYTVAELELELETLEREIEVLRLKRSLRYFLEKAWSYVEPTMPFVSNWHIDELCKVLEGVTAGRTKRVLVNVPPGSMKSLLVNVFWPAWEWTTNPTLGYVTASYSSHLSIRDNSRVRTLVESNWYRETFGVELDPDNNGKQLFKNKQGGWRFGTSVGGGGTGEHPDRVIVDDPHTAKQAMSETERKTACAWFDSTISTRGVVRDVAVIVIMQRLHNADLTGHLLAKWDPESYTHVMWPMRFDPDRADPRDHRKIAGQLLWPELFTPEKVRQLEIDLQEHAPGQLQQQPALKSGSLFKREWFKIIEAMPANVVRIVRAWDTAATENDGDYTTGCKMAQLDDGRFVVMHMERGQWSPAGVDSVIHSTAKADGRKTAVVEEKEGGSSGKTVIAARAKLLAGYDYEGLQVDSDKVTRSRPLRAQFEAGNVLLLAGRWNRDYIEELVLFPFGENDDQVDASSAAFNTLTKDTPTKKGGLVW